MVSVPNLTSLLVRSEIDPLAEEISAPLASLLNVYTEAVPGSVTPTTQMLRVPP